MAKVPFGETKDAEEYSLLPAGKYLVEIKDVEQGVAKSQDEQWKLKMEIVEGEFKGQMVFDQLTFNEKAFPRIKKVYGAVGYDTSKSRECVPDDLKEAMVVISVELNTFKDSAGNEKTNNKVAYAGYYSADTWGVEEEAVTEEGPATEEAEEVKEEVPAGKKIKSAK